MANLMGFKRVSKVPAPKGHSIYDPLLLEVNKTGGIYVLDTQDRKRAYSLATTLRQLIRKREYADLRAGVVDTTVYVKKIKRSAE